MFTAARGPSWLGRPQTRALSPRRPDYAAPRMTWFHALLLGILEGLTEFLPVSSTGHLFLFGALLGHEDEATKALDIVMQLGAVIAVVVFYRARLLALGRGVLSRDPASQRLLLALFVGFLPAAVVGLAVHKKIRRRSWRRSPSPGRSSPGGW